MQPKLLDLGVPAIFEKTAKRWWFIVEENPTTFLEKLHPLPSLSMFYFKLNWKKQLISEEWIAPVDLVFFYRGDILHHSSPLLLFPIPFPDLPYPRDEGHKPQTVSVMWALKEVYTVVGEVGYRQESDRAEGSFVYQDSFPISAANILYSPGLIT